MRFTAVFQQIDAEESMYDGHPVVRLFGVTEVRYSIFTCDVRDLPVYTGRALDYV